MLASLLKLFVFCGSVNPVLCRFFCTAFCLEIVDLKLFGEGESSDVVGNGRSSFVVSSQHVLLDYVRKWRRSIEGKTTI